LRIGNEKDAFVFKCLLDSGDTDPMINLWCTPSSVTLDVCTSAKFLTTQGEFTSIHTVILQDLCLPEFSFSHCFKEVKAFVFNMPNCPCDILLGHKFMKRAKMQLNFNTSQTNWLGSIVPFHPRDYFSDKSKLHSILEHMSVWSDIVESYSATHATIKDAVYKLHDPVITLI
jgi:hypothetical protein